MTIREVLKISIEKLKENKIEEPILKAKMLVSHVLDKEKEYLIINEDKLLSNEQIKRINKGIDNLLKGIPIQYITNTQEFMGLDFYVDENVLIPQPDTEILVEEVLEILKKINNPKILDLCTGSGAIAISIAKKYVELGFVSAHHIIASDICCKALNVAKINCKKQKEDIELIESDLFKNIKEKFNIIISNPPYIETNVIKTLIQEVQYEPKLALDGGFDGLDFYRRIINEAHSFLEPNGYLCLEIGYNQKDNVINLIKQSKEYCNIYYKRDLAGNDRIVICQKNNI